MRRIVPGRVTAELAKTIGRVLGRPSFLPAPSFALKALFGEGAVPLITGQNAVPRALQAIGFQWQFPKLEDALRDCLNG
jgi:NAD dependent epimerase/dehydratase family enzyme